MVSRFNRSLRDLQATFREAALLKRVIALAAVSALTLSACGPIRDKRIPSPVIDRSYTQSSPFDLLPSTVNDLCFVNNDLYASTSKGILRFNEGKFVERLYWPETPPPFRVFCDTADKKIWVGGSDLTEFVVQDDSGWTFVPSPYTGHSLTRAESLHGFRAHSTDAMFYLEGLDQFWKWDDIQKIWISQSGTNLKCSIPSSQRPISECFVGIGTTATNVYLIVRRDTIEAVSAGLNPDKPSEFRHDIVLIQRNGSWEEVKLAGKEYYFIGSIVSGKSFLYLITDQGEVLKVGGNELTMVPTPGPVLAGCGTTQESLIAYIDGAVYQYNGEWRKLFGASGSNLHDARIVLAEKDGHIALAIGYDRRQAVNSGCHFTDYGSGWYFDGKSASCLIPEN